MPELSDESVLRKWMAIEMGRINDGVVVERPRLFALIASDRPVAVTRGGKEYRFDVETLGLLNEKLPQGIKQALKVPIVFYFDSNVADSCFLTDGVELEALQILGELSRMRTMNEGKVWVGRAIVYSLMRKYPSVIQIHDAVTSCHHLSPPGSRLRPQITYPKEPDNIKISPVTLSM